MRLLAINLYELGQFLRIVLWVFVPIFVLVLLITTYLHHRRKRKEAQLVLNTGDLLLTTETLPMESIPADSEQPDEDNLYKGMLWMKEKFEAYRIRSDERMGDLRIQLDQRGATIDALKDQLSQAQEKIISLSTKLETNMSLMMNIHKELDRSMTPEIPVAVTPEAANGGSGDLAKE